MEFDAGTWWLIGILLTFLIGALGWMVKRSLDKIERKLDSAATKTELEKEVGECKQQIAEIQHTYTTRSQHQQDWTECHNDIKSNPAKLSDKGRLLPGAGKNRKEARPDIEPH